MIGWLFNASLALGAAQPAPGPDAVSAEHRQERLDALLAARDYRALGQTVAAVRQQADLRSDLDWLQARMIEGNSAFIPMLYSRLLWVASEGLPEAQRHQLRQTSAMAMLYALAAIEVDGTRCGDRTAPAHRAEQLMTWNPPALTFIGTLSQEERERLIEVALLTEARTAARRDANGDVDFLCRSGMEETQYNLTHGTAREVPSQPGQPGRTVELSGDGRYTPSEVPLAQRQATAAQKRQALRAELTRFVQGLSRPPAPARP